MSDNEATTNAVQQTQAQEGQQSGSQSTQTKPNVASGQPEFIQSITNDQVKQNIQRTYDQNQNLTNQNADLQRQLNEANQTIRENEVAALNAAGKAQEALELQVKHLTEQLSGQNQKVVELTRDHSVQGELVKYQFATDFARDLALSQIKTELVQNEQGQWVNRAGLSIQQTVEAFVLDENHSFMLSQKQSKGSKTMQEGQFNQPSNNDGTVYKGKLQDQTQEQFEKMLHARTFPNDGGIWDY